MCRSILHPLVMTIEHIYDVGRFRLGLGTFLETFAAALFNPTNDGSLVEDLTPLNNLLTTAFNCMADVNNGPGLSLLGKTIP